jgi:hypothetical protein
MARNLYNIIVKCSTYKHATLGKQGEIAETMPNMRSFLFRIDKNTLENQEHPVRFATLQLCI